MLHTRFFRIITVFAITSLSALSLDAKAGADHFKVYLNNKLIIEQYMGRTFTLQQLQLADANINDKLTFTTATAGRSAKAGK